MAHLVINNPISFGSQVKTEDKNYFMSILIPYLEEKSFYTLVIVDGKHYYEPKLETRIMLLAANYMVNTFSIRELRIIFSDCKDYTMDEGKILSNKSSSIRSINSECLLSKEEAKRLKRKVWNMDSITYGLVLYLIKSSGLFSIKRIGDVLETKFEFK